MTRTELEFASKLAAERYQSAQRFVESLKLPNGVHHVEMLMTFDDGAVMDVEVRALANTAEPEESPAAPKSDTYCGVAAVALIGIILGWFFRGVAQ